jgi:hypothetical protein
MSGTAGMYTEVHALACRQVADLIGPFVDTVVMLQRERRRRERLAAATGLAPILGASLKVGDVLERLDLARPVRYSVAAMTLYLTPFVLIGALIVLGVLVGVGLVLFAPTRERPDARPAGDETPEATDGDWAA